MDGDGFDSISAADCEAGGYVIYGTTTDGINLPIAEIVAVADEDEVLSAVAHYVVVAGAVRNMIHRLQNA